MLEAGKHAPAFTLPDADMELVKLSDFKGKNAVVLFFYVRDDTPGCTTEAIEFSDHDEEFADRGVVILGISRDDCISHAEFRDKHGISVRLLADKDGEVHRKYGVLQEREVDGVKRLSAVRSTFIIDRHGNVRRALYGVPSKGHALQVLKLLDDLAK